MSHPNQDIGDRCSNLCDKEGRAFALAHMQLPNSKKSLTEEIHFAFTILIGDLIMTISDQEKLKFGKLAQKNIFVLLLLTIGFNAFGGYIYTGRYFRLIIFWGIMYLFVTVIDTPGIEIAPEFSFVIPASYVISFIDNYFAINKARNKLIYDLLGPDDENQYQPQNTQNTPYNKFEKNIQIRLIKLAREKGEITKTDCVLETGMSAKKIQTILDQMLKDELIAVSNRTDDGVIVYRSL
ncbi:hypothetical protein NG791_14230 [Laspinema sp. D1]|uniref:hypothetical protein n=1 Tax=Laspinema palackyanum TaxID=3231601 RepID=UPI00348ADDD0|nr:hypothetical protein [Laspinema sp. D2b]